MAKTTAFLSLILIATIITVSSTALISPYHPLITITNNTTLEATVICQFESVPLPTYYGTKTLNTTSPVYQFSVTDLNVTSSCIAYWNTHYFANWDAFDPIKDKNLEAVYWSIRQRGVFYSRDRLKWRLDSEWQTE